MEIPKIYQPVEVEEKWNRYWQEQNIFHSEPDEREPYTIVIPPPNVTGILHMGHMLNNTIQDVLIRKARMEGKNACWVPGTDHASIATEAKVVQKLQREGIDKSTLTREEFMEHAWEWKEKHGGIILQQLKKLGASCDWQRTAFTMDPLYSESVIDTFIDLYQKNYIYRGERMVNWDPAAQTALSDEEVVHKEVQSKLYYVKYKIAGTGADFLTVATTRPETILGDTAICINPNDPRFFHLHGKKAIVPLAEREVPIILDEYVDIEFGTGCLKITPAHDFNDHEIGKRHNLPSIDVLTAEGKMSEAAGFYVGEDRLAVRKKIAEDLEKMGLLVKTEEHPNKVGFSERTDVPIEPRISMQWFLSMKELSKPALENVLNGEIKFWPPKFVNSYRHWMENIKDWCISRQLWWGHRIPVYYYGLSANEFVVAKNSKEALAEARKKSGNNDLKETDLRQDEDVLDTWFSSWLWPISVFNGFYSKEEIDYYYPTNDLVTAPEIMFFWVARMIVAGYEYRNEKPFRNVYFTGIVRDKAGRKMSKSLGNSPDPLELIATYGADGVRTGMLFSSPAGNDLLFDVSLCEQGRNFSNKLWNALRLMKSWEVSENPQPEYAGLAGRWLESRFNELVTTVNDLYDKFRISEMLMECYKFAWNDLCSWYLEMIKPPFGSPIDPKTMAEAEQLFDKTLRILHPLMPFITEEIWHLLQKRPSGSSISLAPWPVAEPVDKAVLADFEKTSNVISQIRNIRTEKNLAFKNPLELIVIENSTVNRQHDVLIRKMGNITSLQYSTEKPAGAFGFMVGPNEYFIPFGADIDLEEERKKVLEELEYTRGFLKSVEKKLANSRFVDNAPAQVVDLERRKKEDATQKIEVLEEKLKSLQTTS